ncbi:hypothetical protein [Pseudomonas viridiflava]|uniref:hypothetical protein n=1 Tax=Pseudomonas viridiflava TaxID=33069 RepID=UPI000F01A8F2|nr:hypothetical protein [Pseudomonas viridiflava]
MKPEPFSKNRFKLNLDGIDHAFQVLAFKGHEAIPATAKTCNWKPSQMTIVVYLEVTYQIKDHCIGRLK